MSRRIASPHATGPGPWLNPDLYRLSVSIEGEGWKARLRNGLTAAPAGESRPVLVYVSHVRGAAPSATVTLRACSESDPSITATARAAVTASKR